MASGFLAIAVIFGAIAQVRLQKRIETLEGEVYELKKQLEGRE